MWYGVDPLAEEYVFQSPYVYAANNPVKFVDVNGMGPGGGEPETEVNASISLQLTFGTKGQIISIFLEV